MIKEALLSVILTFIGPDIKQFEGYSAEPYRDAGKVWTQCWGHASVEKPAAASRDQCENYFRADVTRAAEALDRCSGGALEGRQLAALTSWAFNVGTGAACRSTLMKKVKQGQTPDKYCKELKRWVYVNGKKSRGLERRRAAEYRICKDTRPLRNANHR